MTNDPPIEGMKPTRGQQQAQRGTAGAAVDGAMPVPAAWDMERCALSCIMQAPEHCVKDMKLLEPGDFYVEAHSLIYDVMQRQLNAGQLVEPVSLTRYFMDRGMLEKVGGAGHLSEILTASPNPAHFSYYAEEVRVKAKARRAVEAMQKAFGAILREPTAEMTEQQVNHLVDQLLQVTRSGDTQRIVHIKEPLLQAVEELEEGLKNRGHVLGDICTGYTDIDRCLIKGLQRRCNYVIAGDTGSGKTAFAMGILLNMALARGHYKEFYNYPESSYTNRVTDWQAEVNEGRAVPRHRRMKVLMVCLESSQVEMAMQALLSEAAVDVRNLWGGFMDRETMPKIQQSAIELCGTQFYLWDAPGLSVEELALEIKNFKLQHPDLDVVCVDHAGLLDAHGIKDKGNETAIAGYVSNNLLNLYHRINVVGITLWQLNRDAASKGEKGKRPTRSSLRASGKIEQDAHAILLPYRPAHYDSEADPEEAFIVIAKARGCPINLDGVRMMWHGPTKRFLSQVKWTEAWHDELKQEDMDQALTLYEKYEYGDAIKRDRLFSVQEEQQQVK